MTTSARDTEIEALRQQVADRDAKLRDQARKIAELTNDVASLKAVVEKMLAQRGGGMKVPAGQGLLFAEPAAQAEPTKATSEVAAEPDDGSANATTPTKQASKKKGTTCPKRSASIP